MFRYLRNAVRHGLSASTAKEKELAKIMRYKQALYQDWKDGEITRNDYWHMSEDYENTSMGIDISGPEDTMGVIY